LQILRHFSIIYFDHSHQVRRSEYATEKLVHRMQHSSAGHSQLVVTGLKSAVLDMPRKSWYATCSAVKPVTPNWS
jgi:hypothetical protein